MTVEELEDGIMTLDEVRAWREAAITDGWSPDPIYTQESEDRAMRLTKDGWIAHASARPSRPDPFDKRRTMPAQADITVWGPDQLQIHPEVPVPYSWNRMNALLRRCAYCKTEDVETKRVGFAGRCCLKCLPAMRKKIEFPGWCD